MAKSFEKVDETTFKKIEQVETVKELRHLISDLDILDRQIASFQSRRAELAQDIQAIKAIGVKEKENGTKTDK